MAADPLELVKQCKASLKPLQENKKSAADIEEEIKQLKKELLNLRISDKKLKKNLVKTVKALPKGGDVEDFKDTVKDQIKSKYISPFEVGEALKKLEKELKNEEQNPREKSEIESLIVLQEKVKGALNMLKTLMDDVKFSEITANKCYTCNYKGKKFNFEIDKGKQKQEFYLEIYVPYQTVLEKMDDWKKATPVKDATQGIDEGLTKERDAAAKKALLDYCKEIEEAVGDAENSTTSYKPPMILNDRKDKKAVADYLKKIYSDFLDDLEKLIDKKLS